MAGGVAPVAVGVGADEVDGVVNLEVGEGLGEVVEGFGSAADCYEDLAVPVAEGFADSLAPGLVVNRLAVVNQRELAEEGAALLDRFLEEGGAVGRADRNAAVDNTAIAPFGEAPGERLAVHHKGAGNAPVVGPDVCSLGDQDDSLVMDVRRADGQPGNGIVRDKEGQRHIVDHGIDPFGISACDTAIRAAER